MLILLFSFIYTLNASEISDQTPLELTRSLSASEKLLEIMERVTRQNVSRRLYAAEIQSLCSFLVETDNDLYVETVSRMLWMIRFSACSLSDEERMKLLELIGVYSVRIHELFFDLRPRERLFFFEPEYWSVSRSDIARNNEEKHSIIDFYGLPSKQRLLVMTSRIVTQSMYPFFVEIESLHRYLAETVNAKNGRNTSKSKPWCPRIAHSYSVSNAYLDVAAQRPFLYFAVLYYEATMNALGFDLSSFSESVRTKMSEYKFIQWTPSKIEMVKAEYFRNWRNTASVHRHHSFDFLDDHQTYHDLLGVHGAKHQSLRLSVTTQCILEAFDVWTNEPFGDIRSVFIYHPAMTRSFLFKLLDLGIEHFVRRKKNLYLAVLRVFAAFGDRDDIDLLFVLQRYQHSTNNELYKLHAEQFEHDAADALRLFARHWLCHVPRTKDTKCASTDAMPPSLI